MCMYMCTHICTCTWHVYVYTYMCTHTLGMCMCTHTPGHAHNLDNAIDSADVAHLGFSQLTGYKPAQLPVVTQQSVTG